MKTFIQILKEASSQISKEDLVPGFTFFILSKDKRSLSRFKVVDEIELNVGPTLNVKHSVIAGDKFKQDKIAKDFVLGKKGDLMVFKKQADAMSAFKMSGFRESSKLPDSIKSASRKEKISLLRRAGFTGVNGMSDADLNDSLLRAMERIKKGRGE